MWRSFFLSVGICSVLLGLESLVVEKLVIAASEERDPGSLAGRFTPGLREVEPPEWAPWSLLSGGAVVILYTFTLPEKIKS